MVDEDERGFHPEHVDAFSGYSPSGEAEGQLVYAHYARREDFEELERIGVTMEGKICVARYGRVRKHSPNYLRKY